jgi:hypothetical protein
MLKSNTSQGSKVKSPIDGQSPNEQGGFDLNARAKLDSDMFNDATFHGIITEEQNNDDLGIDKKHFIQ